MARKRFVSGNLTVDIKYSDRGPRYDPGRGQYIAKVCVRDEKTCERVTVLPPAHLERAVDSPRAYAEAARSAIAFSRHSEEADYDKHLANIVVRRPRRR